MGQVLASVSHSIATSRLFMQSNLSEVAKLERLSPLVYRVLGCNSGAFTLQGTNTYLIGSGKSRILIDTGDSGYTEYTDNLRATLHEQNAEIDTIICTHWHRDHVGGVPDVINKVLNGSSHQLLKVRNSEQDDAKYAPNGYKYLNDGDELKVEGATLRVITTPGHTSDHMSLLLLEENSIFSGDCILGEGTAVFEDLHTYMRSLQRLLDCKPNRIYPGHGPVVENGSTKIQEYIMHRNQREKQIVDYMRAQNDPVDVYAIVDGVYGKLSIPLRMGAANNVRHHLSKLIKDDVVVETTKERYRLKQTASM